MTLDRAHPGEQLRIAAIANREFRLHALRMGLGEGEHVVCEDALPGGPVLVRRHRQTIAIGRALARAITVISC